MVAAVLIGEGPPAACQTPRLVVVITVDALRVDRLSTYGYQRPTSPAIDALLAEGLRFENARTVEPLTGPSMSSMVTGIEPQEHGATRNGLRIRPDLDSLPRILAAQGWATAAFVSNWTLKNNVTHLGDHFDYYGEVFTRRRWFGLLNSEATGDDVTDETLDWFDRHFRSSPDQPLFVWVHYVEPHAPYRFHQEYANRLGITDRDPVKSDRYDTEVAAADAAIGRLLKGLSARVPRREMIIVFSADHGESLGEHDFWGHGRYLYEPSLHIPMGVVWQGKIEPRVVTEQALILDIAPTVLGLVGLAVPPGFDGFSWAELAVGGDPPAGGRSICYQAHKGAVHGEHDDDRKRSKGLLEVGIVDGDRKEILRINRGAHLVFDLDADPAELDNLAVDGDQPSDRLLGCFGSITEGLGALDRLAANQLDDETVDQLKALGYLE